jgi:hypothetical protein
MDRPGVQRSKPSRTPPGEPAAGAEGEHIWLVTFMQYDLGYFDDETCRLEPIDNPFGSKLLPMSPE